MTGARLLLLAATACAFVAPVPRATAELLYETEFESFQVGPDTWHGTEGWFANTSSQGLGLHGIDDDKAPGLNKTAYLGFNEPASTFTTIARPVNYDPATGGSARIRLDSLLGLEDSTNDRYDSFYVSFYNITGNYLASIRFANRHDEFGIWRDNGIQQFDTTVDFLHGELQLLFVTIDFVNNTWSAEFDGIPLFVGKQFTATSHARTLGSVAYEWLLDSNDPEEHGNNWMLVADCAVWVVPPGQPTVVIQSFEKTSQGNPSLQFLAEPGWSYRVLYTSDFNEWHNDLPGSLIRNIFPAQVVSFEDTTQPGAGFRFYQVERTITP